MRLVLVTLAAAVLFSIPADATNDTAPSSVDMLLHLDGITEGPYRLTLEGGRGSGGHWSVVESTQGIISGGAIALFSLDPAQWVDTAAVEWSRVSRVPWSLRFDVQNPNSAYSWFGECIQKDGTARWKCTFHARDVPEASRLGRYLNGQPIVGTMTLAGWSSTDDTQSFDPSRL